MSLRDPMWPGLPLASIDGDALVADLCAWLDDPPRWQPLSDKDGVAVAVGRTPGCPCKAYRSSVDLDGPLDAVVRLIADDMFERLGDWNTQFQEGHIVRVLEDAPSRKAWLMRVFYATPFILADREYLYYLARHTLPDGRVAIVYCSVDDPGSPPREGYVRGVLHPSIHRCTALTPTRTRLDHILATDIGGSISPWIQNHLFAGGLASAMRADARAQRRLFPA
jgi:hypothetical protein